MSPQANQLLTEALNLAEQDRGELAARLIDSLDPTTEGGIDVAWAAEIHTRLEELESGQVQAIPWAEARRQILEDTD